MLANQPCLTRLPERVPLWVTGQGLTVDLLEAEVDIGDREFHSVKLAYWLKQKSKKKKLFFAFRQKQGTNHKKENEDYQPFSQLGIKPGIKMFSMGVSVTKNKGFGQFNVGAYWKRKYIAIAYTATSLKGKIFRQTQQAKYLARLTEQSRRDRRHSNFWIGLYGSLWINAWDFCSEFVSIMMMNNPQKLSNYQRGLKALSLIEFAA